jgi:hypothetical protein
MASHFSGLTNAFEHLTVIGVVTGEDCAELSEIRR